MNSIVNTSWDPSLIALSFAFAVIGSFVALTAANRLTNRRGALDWTNVLAVGVALGGVGVWSMHFIGMFPHGRPAMTAECYSSLISCRRWRR